MQRRQLIQLAISSGALLTTGYSRADSRQYSPTNLAFITDISRHTLAIANINHSIQSDSLDLPILPKLIASSKDSPYLAFTDRIISGVYLYDLNAQRLHHFDLPTPAYKLFFLPKTSLLIVALESQIALLDYKTGNLDILPGHFQGKFAHFSTVINSISGHISILQKSSNNIQTIRILQPNPHWQILPVSAEQGFAHGITDPANTILAFTDYYRTTGYLYDIHRKTLLEQLQLCGNTLLIDPYISDNGYAVFATLDGALRVYPDPHNPDRILTARLDFAPRYLRSGWLDKYLIVGGDEHLGIYPFDDLDNGTVFTFGYEEDIADMWVSGDSKLLLFGTERSSALGRYDLQQQRRLPDIPLTGIAEVGKIRMTTTNTVCY